MRGRRVLVTGLVVALLGAAVVWVVQRSHHPATTHRVESVDVAKIEPGRTVYVESGERRTTFLPLGPPGPVAGRTLSAQRAYNLLVSDSPKLQLIPPSVQPYYGVLTDGSTSPMALHTRVWAFATTSGCVTTGGGSLAGDTTRSPGPVPHCRLWEFVDARSGHDLGVVTQEVLPD